MNMAPEQQRRARNEEKKPLLFNSLEEFNQANKKRRGPTIILGAIFCLFLASAGGIILAVLLIISPVEFQGACLARDLILFASGMALLYIVLHVRGAMKNRRRIGPGPPQIYGDHLHASALLVARLGIAIWIAALIGTAVFISKAVPFVGFEGKTPFLDLLICIFAVPSFVLISVTIERDPHPFATTALSKGPHLVCRVSAFAEDLAADASVSRRASLQHKQNLFETASSLSSTEMTRDGVARPGSGHVQWSSHGAEKASNTKTAPTTGSPVKVVSSAPPKSQDVQVPSAAVVPPRRPHSPVEPKYNPGGWRTEWDDAAGQFGVESKRYASGASSGLGQSTRISTESSAITLSTSRPAVPRSPFALPPSHYANRPPVAHSASLTVPPTRQAKNQNDAVQLPRPLFEHTGPSPAAIVDTSLVEEGESGLREPDRAFTLVRNAQRALRSPAPQIPNMFLTRSFSNFCRPLQLNRATKAEVVDTVRIPGAFVSNGSD